LLTIPLLKIRRIVVLTKAGLGDAVYVVPALRALRCHFAQAQITLIASQRGYPLLSRCPYADRIYQSYLGSGALGKAREVLRLIRGRYDLAVVLDASVEKILFTYLARIRYRAGCANKGGGKYLTQAATIPDDAHQISDLNRAPIRLATSIAPCWMPSAARPTIGDWSCSLTLRRRQVCARSCVRWVGAGSVRWWG